MSIERAKEAAIDSLPCVDEFGSLEAEFRLALEVFLASLNEAGMVVAPREAR